MRGADGLDMRSQTLNMMARSNIEKITGDFRWIICSRMGLTAPTGTQGGERADMSGETLNIMTQSSIEKDYAIFR